MASQKLDNLFKDPRTNWNYILIIVILGILVGIGILGYYYLWIAELETRLAELEVRLPEVKTSEEAPPEEVSVDEIAGWKTYQILSSFTDLRGEKKFLVLVQNSPEPESGFVKSDLYLTSDPENFSKGIKIVEVGLSELGKCPCISSNIGIKYIVVELLGPGDYQDFAIIDENGNEIKMDRPALGLDIKIPGMYGLHFGQWQGSTINFSIDILTGDGSEFKAIFDASTGKLIGEVQKIK